MVNSFKKHNKGAFTLSERELVNDIAFKSFVRKFSIIRIESQKRLKEVFDSSFNFAQYK